MKKKPHKDGKEDEPRHLSLLFFFSFLLVCVNKRVRAPDHVVFTYECRSSAIVLERKEIRAV